MNSPIFHVSTHRHYWQVHCLVILSVLFVTSSCQVAPVGRSAPLLRSPSTSLPVLSLAKTSVAGTAPLSVTFAANCSTCVNYAWKFGDGASGTGSSPSHIYESTGTYEPVVTATDSYGQSATGAAVITVSGGSGTLDAVDAYCQFGSQSWGSVDGPAILPHACMNTDPLNTPSNGDVVAVSTASELATALGGASCGTDIKLLPGAVFSGHFTVPALSGCAAAGNYVILESSAIGSSLLPAYGQQITPCFSGLTSLLGRPAFACPPIPGNYTAQIITPDSQAALTLSGGLSGLIVRGVEITRAAGTGPVGNLILMGNVGVDHIVFDRDWIHGDENRDETTFGLSTSAASSVAVVNSYMNDFYCISKIGACTDAHPIQGGSNTLNSNSETVLKIVNNFLEGSGQSILMGGGAANTTVGDLEIRLNTMFKPQQWNPLDPSYNGGINGYPLITKGVFELKNAQRVLFEGNQIINDWGGFTQDGAAVLLTPKSQARNGQSLCLNCFVSNVTIRYSTINSVGVIGEFEAVADDAGGLSSGGTGWSIHDIVADNLQYSTCFECGKGVIAISESPSVNANQKLSNVNVNHVTAVLASTAANSGHAIGLSGASISSGNDLSGIVFTNNLLSIGTGTLNLIGGGVTDNCAYSQDTGTNMISNCWSPFRFGGNCFVNNGSVVWPGTNVTSVPSYSAAFTDYNNGDKGNYTVAAGACKGSGLDGLDPGANIPEIESIISNKLGTTL
jgi:hypothetical protein